MAERAHYENLILGSGAGGKLLAWHLAGSRRRTAVVERRWIGGSCPNVACLPSKNQIWSAKVADLLHHGSRFGAGHDGFAVDMAMVWQRKRDMVDDLVALHLTPHDGRRARLAVRGDPGAALSQPFRSSEPRSSTPVSTPEHRAAPRHQTSRPPR